MPAEVAHDTGDMLAATRAGIAFDDRMASLSALIAGRVARQPQDIVLYKSVGSALQDVVTAEMLLARAQAQGIGSFMARSIVPVAK
jgi:ornithine cyclodeaminase/alanine dehydrogenase